MSAKKAAKQLTPREQRAKEERNLRRFATTLRKMADDVDVAATYWGDGANLTTYAMLTGSATVKRGRPVKLRLLGAVRYLGQIRWSVGPDGKRPRS